MVSEIGTLAVDPGESVVSELTRCGGCFACAFFRLKVGGGDSGLFVWA